MAAEVATSPLTRMFVRLMHGSMESRVTALEKAAEDTRNHLTRIEVRLDSFATKSDIGALEATFHKELHGLTWRLIGVAGALVAAVYFVAKHA